MGGDRAFGWVLEFPNDHVREFVDGDVNEDVKGDGVVHGRGGAVLVRVVRGVV